MTINTTSGSAILTPEQVQQLVIQPLMRQSVAMQVSTVVQTSSHSTRFPIVQSDPTTAWTAEGAEINISDADLDELEVIPRKLAGLTVVSNELVNDSDPSALEVVGAGLVRDLQVRLDAAYFGTTVANGPNGIESTGYQLINGGSAFTNLDAFAKAQSKAETAGAQVTAWVAHPTTLLTLSQVKIGTDFNLPLLGPDATSATGRSILGAPAYWSPAVGEGEVWGVPKAKVFVVIRNDTSVVTDSSAFFSSDRTAVRCTLRIGFAFPHVQAIVKVGMGGS
jgi:HK97 family phage major capsid protein